MTDYRAIAKRLRVPAFWSCESSEGHPGDATALAHEAADALDKAAVAINEAAEIMIEAAALLNRQFQ